MQIPVEWVLGVIASLATVVSGLAGLLWNTMQSRLAKQDVIIKNLQDDVDRLSHGCGHPDCLWGRRPKFPHINTKET